MIKEDWGSSDWSAVKKYIDNGVSNGMEQSDAMSSASEYYYQDMGYNSPDEALNIIKQKFMDTTNNSKLNGQAKPDSVVNERMNPKHTNFAINKASGKILEGFDYSDVAKESLSETIKANSSKSLREKTPGLNLSEVQVVTRGYLTKKGIDPMVKENWEDVKESTEDMSVAESTEDMSVAEAEVPVVECEDNMEEGLPPRHNPEEDITTDLKQDDLDENGNFMATRAGKDGKVFEGEDEPVAENEALSEAVKRFKQIMNY